MRVARAVLIGIIIGAGLFFMPFLFRFVLFFLLIGFLFRFFFWGWRWRRWGGWGRYPFYDYRYSLYEGDRPIPIDRDWHKPSIDRNSHEKEYPVH
ncbi:MAG: hypothetical protein M3342_09955 [Bacteroidota bacterium]|nr:hypothetical protein [Bacteroidota bacterium]